MRSVWKAETLFTQQFKQGKSGLVNNFQDGYISDIPEAVLEGAQKSSHLQFGIFSKGHGDCVLCNRGVKKSINIFLHLRSIKHMV